MSRALFLFFLVLSVAGCSFFGGDYIQPFERASVWAVEPQNGVDLHVYNQRLVLGISLPDTQYWTLAGRNRMGDGTYRVVAEQIEGSSSAAYGLVFGATELTDFLYFMVSSDGFYSLGRCVNGCEEPTDVTYFGPTPWQQNNSIALGLNQPHTIQAVVSGSRVTLSIDGTEVGTINDVPTGIGDIGVILQSFDAGAVVAFDDLTYLQPGSPTP